MTIVELLTSIANAIREKKKTTDKINAQNLAFEIKSIEPPLDTIEIQQAGLYDVKDYKYADVGQLNLEAEYMAVLEGTATEIHVPEGTTQLRRYAIYGSAMDSSTSSPVYGTTVHIPVSVTKIEENLFDMMSSYWDQRIKYAGTLGQWASQGLGPAPQNGYYLYIDNELVNQITDITEFKQQPTSMASLPCGCLGTIILNRLFIPNGSSVLFAGLAKTIAKEIIFEGTLNGELSPYSLSDAKPEKIILPTSITTIPNNCFKGATLEEIAIPEGVTRIESSAFVSATINKVILPSTLETIEGTKLGTYSISGKYVVVINAKTPPIASASPFQTSYRPKTIYIPSGTLTAYQSATNWANFSDKFVEMNEIALNVQAELLNNEEYQYSLDGGQNWSVFTSETINLEEVALIKFKNANTTTRLLIGLTVGDYDIGSITDAELTYETTGSMTIYLRLGEATETE